MPSRTPNVLSITKGFLREIPASPKIDPVVKEPEPLKAAAPRPKHPVGTGADRRRRWRAKIVGRVMVRGSIGTIDAFEDVGKTVDVNRDGVLLNTTRSGYWVGQPLQVVFPYWTTPTAINTARPATVVRNLPLDSFRYAVAVKFDEPRAPGAAVGVVSSSHVKILCVEPNKEIARSVRELLTHDGYQVVMVATPDEALDVLRSETPHAVLAEAEGAAGSGGPSGRELCTLIKRTHRLQHIPVILLTNSALPSDYSASRRAGAMLCVPMPCDPERLQRAVHLVAPPPGERSAYAAGFNVSPFVRSS